MVGYHVIFGAYGFWLPNDPRGSWSDFVGSWELFRYGPATTTDERRSQAYEPHDRAKRLAAKKALKHPAVNFTGAQIEAIAAGFNTYFLSSGRLCWACAIMPDHVHLAVGMGKIDIEQYVIQLKGEATQALVDKGLHPFQDLVPRNARPPKCFARGEWKVYLDPPDVPRCVGYVDEDPEKEGRPRQKWSFVTPSPSDYLLG